MVAIKALDFDFRFFALPMSIAWAAAILSTIAFADTDKSDFGYGPPGLRVFVAESSLIVVGTALDPWFEAPEGFMEPITVWPFEVEEVWYSDPAVDSLSAWITVCSPGGRYPSEPGEPVNDIWIPHAAQLVPGKKSLLFLTKLRHLNTATGAVVGGFEHFDITQGMWGLSLINDEGNLYRSAWDGESLEAMHGRIAELAQERSPRTLSRRADAIVIATIGSTAAVLPDSVRGREPTPLEKFASVNVTPVKISRWVKGSGPEQLEISEPTYISLRFGWEDWALLPEGERAFLFLERRGDDWRMLDGPGGIYCIDQDGQVFSWVTHYLRRFIGIHEIDFAKLVEP